MNVLIQVNISEWLVLFISSCILLTCTFLTSLYKINESQAIFFCQQWLTWSLLYFSRFSSGRDCPIPNKYLQHQCPSREVLAKSHFVTFFLYLLQQRAPTAHSPKWATDPCDLPQSLSIQQGFLFPSLSSSHVRRAKPIPRHHPSRTSLQSNPISACVTLPNK